MKKLIALLLALLMVATVALVSCSGNKGTQGGNADNDANTEEDNGLVIPGGVGSSETTDAGSNTTDTSVGGNNNNQVDPDTFKDIVIPYSVYTYTATKIRPDDNMKGEVALVEASAELKVVAESNTWYKVKYGTYEGYVLKDFVSKVKNDTIFTDFDPADYKTVQIKGNAEDIKQINFREYPIVADYEYLAQKVKTLTYAETSNGELLKVGENASGTWYKVSYAGETYYLKINDDTKPLLTVDGQDLGGSSQGGI